MLISLQLRKISGWGGTRPPSERTEQKHGFHFCSFSILCVPHSLPLQLRLTEHGCKPLEGTEWNELWPDACFLRKRSSSCLSLVSPTMLFQRAALFPLRVLCVVSEAPKSAGCCGNETQEHKKPFLSTNPGHRHICQHRNRRPGTQPKTRFAFNMGFRPWELMLYIFEKSDFQSSELYMQMWWVKPDICISAIHSFLINLYDQMTNRLISHRSCILYMLVQELNIRFQNSSPKPIGKNRDMQAFTIFTEAEFHLLSASRYLDSEAL